jgi:CheY-like chemotaxis protein
MSNLLKIHRSSIILIDDDNEDLELIKEAIESVNIKNEVIAFNDPLKFLEFIRSAGSKTFFTLCDINMAPINGLELKKIIQDDEDLRLKCVPFIFLSTTRASNEIMKAYSFGAQGFFVKPNSIEEIKERVTAIINYWKYSERPYSEG